MIVDTSVLVALLREEAESTAFVRILAAATGRSKVSAATYVEAGIVTDGNDDDVLSARLDAIIALFRIDIVPVTPDQARIARAAYRTFGKDRHPARLNFGDCFAYALARELNEPLLFKGDDFTHTDVTPALAA